jgi:hypothetical protein
MEEEMINEKAMKKVQTMIQKCKMTIGDWKITLAKIEELTVDGINRGINVQVLGREARGMLLSLLRNLSHTSILYYYTLMNLL